MTNGKDETVNMIYKDASLPLERRVQDLLSRMSLAEKSAQLGSCWSYQLLEDLHFSTENAANILKNGIGQITRIGGASSLDPVDGARLANDIQKHLVENTRLGIPAIVHEESCSGFMAKGATCFPQTIGMACTWEPELMKEIGTVIRTQMRAAGAHQALAPLLDITRDPRWGRVEETFGEDPYLVSRMGTSYVQGLQGDDLKTGVMATGKHFVGYGNSEGGMNWAPAHIPQRELREVYLLPFEAAVREAGLASVMNGYHELDGVPCGCSRELLNDILREQWGFDGLVVSDYFAINMLYEYHHVAKDDEEAARLALEAGLDVELPHTHCYGDILIKAVEEGRIDIALVDLTVERILRMKFRLGLFEQPYVEVNAVTGHFDNAAQRKLAYEAACKSIVLLKNENNILPLKKASGSIAVIGPNADNVRNMLGDYAYPCHIETLLEVRDSSNTFSQPLPGKMNLEDNFVSIETMLEALHKNAPAGTRIQYAKGCDIIGTSKDSFDEAVRCAEKADVAVMFVGDKAGLIPDCTCGESRDLAELNLPGVQEELVKAVHATGTPVVVVLVNGRPFSFNWMADHVAAIVEAWLPGEEGAQAVADVLFGDCNPGGKLCITFPRSSGQIPVFYSHKKSGGHSHWRGDYVDMTTKPLYPFGYGLSYTEFKYEDLSIGQTGSQVEIGLKVENTGCFKGDEVVQLYFNDPEASVTRPVKELKGFKRITLEPGEVKRVVFTLHVNQFGFYDRDMKYVLEPGRIGVMVGSSSEDIRLEGSFNIGGEKILIDNDKKFFSETSVWRDNG